MSPKVNRHIPVAPSRILDAPGTKIYVKIYYLYVCVYIYTCMDVYLCIYIRVCVCVCVCVDWGGAFAFD